MNPINLASLDKPTKVTEWSCAHFNSGQLLPEQCKQDCNYTWKQSAPASFFMLSKLNPPQGKKRALKINFFSLYRQQANYIDCLKHQPVKSNIRLLLSLFILYPEHDLFLQRQKKETFLPQNAQLMTLFLQNNLVDWNLMLMVARGREGEVTGYNSFCTQLFVGLEFDDRK